jgi:SAM-dependent methyltransferase
MGSWAASAMAGEACSLSRPDPSLCKTLKSAVIETYYNQLAPYYKFMFQDWEASVIRQAAALDGVIREFVGPQAHRILDCACGIGTQSIGLAQLGYTVTASDISPGELVCAQAEAVKRDLHIEFGIADMRRLSAVYSQPFDVVLACDNAVPHLLSDAETRQAFEQFYQCTVPTGGCVVFVRDYANLERGGVRLYPRTIHATANGRIVVFDMWEFDDEYYDFTTYIVVEDRMQPTATTHVIRGGRYYCVTIAMLEELLKQAGFQETVTLRDRFYQPLILGIKHQRSG